MANDIVFLGFSEHADHIRDWEKDCFYDTYGLYDDDEE